jgi:hypothetical protein
MHTLLYYKVKPASDQVRCSIVYKNQILVKDEIYTPREIEKALQAGSIDMAFIRNHFTRVELRPRDTHYFFGARFQNSNTFTNEEIKH